MESTLWTEKYRPKTLKGVVGQDIVDELQLVEFVNGKSSTQTIEKIQNISN